MRSYIWYLKAKKGEGKRREDGEEEEEKEQADLSRNLLEPITIGQFLEFPRRFAK